MTIGLMIAGVTSSRSPGQAKDCEAEEHNIHVHVSKLSVGEVHTVHCVLVHTCAQVMPFYINYVYMFMHNNIILRMYMPHTYTTHMSTYNRSSQMKL